MAFGSIFLLEAVTCVGFPQGHRGALGRWCCLRVIASEAAELLEAGLGQEPGSGLTGEEAKRELMDPCCPHAGCFVGAPGKGGPSLVVAAILIPPMP